MKELRPADMLGMVPYTVHANWLASRPEKVAYIKSLGKWDPHSTSPFSSVLQPCASLTDEKSCYAKLPTSIQDQGDGWKRRAFTNYDGYWCPGTSCYDNVRGVCVKHGLHDGDCRTLGGDFQPGQGQTMHACTWASSTCASSETL
jgi:hypothetical protein